MPTFIVNFLPVSETFPFCQTHLAVASQPECEPPSRTKKASPDNFVFLLILFFKIILYGPLGLIIIPSLIMTFLGCPKSYGDSPHLYLCKILKAQLFAFFPGDLSASPHPRPRLAFSKSLLNCDLLFESLGFSLPSPAVPFLCFV